MKGTARHWALKLKRKSKNVGNNTSIMDYYPTNGEIGDTERAMNTNISQSNMIIPCVHLG